jgi:hypothetical protein
VAADAGVQGGAGRGEGVSEHPAGARCVMSDGRFAVLGGEGIWGSLSSCEALGIGDAAHWEPLSPMHDSRSFFACAAVAGCVIVAGGIGRTSAEIYDESLDRWLRLPHDLPYGNYLHSMGSALV